MKSKQQIVMTYIFENSWKGIDATEEQDVLLRSSVLCCALFPWMINGLLVYLELQILPLQETILLFFSLNELLIKTRLNSLPKTTFLTGQNLIIWQQNFNRFYQLHLIIPLQLILKISLGSISFQSLSSKSLSSSCFHPPSIGFELIGTIIIIFVQRMERRRSMMYFNFIASLPSSAAYTNAVLLTDYGRLRKRPRRDKAKR